MTLDQKLHDLRRAHGLSQERVAELTGVSRQAVSKWETGLSRPTMDNLTRLAQLYEVPIEEIVRPDTRVILAYDLREELNRLKKTSRWFPAAIIACLVLFAGCFAALLTASWNGAPEQAVFLLACASAVFVLAAFAPLLALILRYVYQDCRRRGIKPAFYVLISLSVVGLAYYLLRRDTL